MRCAPQDVYTALLSAEVLVDVMQQSPLKPRAVHCFNRFVLYIVVARYSMF